MSAINHKKNMFNLCFISLFLKINLTKYIVIYNYLIGFFIKNIVLKKIFFWELKMSTKIVITQSKKPDIDSVPNHIKLQELDGKFIKKI